MAGNFNSYEDRTVYPRGSGYPEGRLTVQDVVDEALRHGSGSATPGGSMRHSYDCGCRDGAWGYGAGNRELEPNALSDLLRRFVNCSKILRCSGSNSLKISRDHLQIDQINRTISSKSVWREVHPKVKHDGTYPKEFTVPRTVEDFKALDGKFFPSQTPIPRINKAHHSQRPRPPSHRLWSRRY